MEQLKELDEVCVGTLYLGKERDSSYPLGPSIIS